MALSKILATSFGDTIAITYLKIAEITINWLQHTATITLIGYSDQKTANTVSSSPLGRYTLEFDASNFPFTDKDTTLVAAYTAIKQDPMWSDATDA